MELGRRSVSVGARSVLDVGPAGHRVENRGEGDRQVFEIPVVDASVVELDGEFTQQPRPVLPGRLHRHRSLDPSFDDLHR